MAANYNNVVVTDDDDDHDDDDKMYARQAIRVCATHKVAIDAAVHE